METESHENCFLEIKIRIASETKNCQCNPQLKTQVNFDASCSIAAVLEKLTVGGWKPIAFISRFL